MARQDPNRHQLVAIGKALRAYRTKAGLTQEALAHEADIHPTYLSGLETGSRNPSLLTLMRVLDALGKTLLDLARDARRSA